MINDELTVLITTRWLNNIDIYFPLGQLKTFDYLFLFKNVYIFNMYFLL